MELATGRNFSVYAQQMDASMRTKLAELGSHIVPGRIVDAGCANGGLIDALYHRYPESEYVGIDCSATFFRQAVTRFTNCANVAIVRGMVEDLDVLVAEPASTVILASVLHEVHSYHGYDETPIHRTLAAAHAVLQPSGRLLIRDGIAPSRAVVALWCNADDGASDGAIEALSTRAIFHRFCTEYRHAVGVPTDTAYIGGRRCFLLRARDAYEFLAKKDYRVNWAQEVEEEYGFWRRREWELALARAGFRILQFDEITNPWIVQHRYRGYVQLLDPVTGAELPWFPTYAVIVAEKDAG